MPLSIAGKPQQKGAFIMIGSMNYLFRSMT